MFYIIYKDMKKVCGLDVHKDSIFLCILAGNVENPVILTT